MMGNKTVKAYKGLGMEGFIASWYASNTRKALNEFQELARRVAAGQPSGASALEVAPGPGYFAIELAKLGDYRIAGIDISRTFVEIARSNAAAEKVDIDFRLGDAASMPFDPDSFDFLLCRAAFKNFAQPVGALREMYRVLKPGAKALIIDLRKDASRESINKMVDGMGSCAVNGAMIKLTFRFMLLRRAYTRRDFEQFISQTNFRGIDIRETLTGFEIWLEK